LPALRTRSLSSASFQRRYCSYAQRYNGLSIWLSDVRDRTGYGAHRCYKRTQTPNPYRLKQTVLAPLPLVYPSNKYYGRNSCKNRTVFWISSALRAFSRFRVLRSNSPNLRPVRCSETIMPACSLPVSYQALA